MANKNSVVDTLVIKGGYVRTRTTVSSSEVTRGTGVHKDKKKDRNKKMCRTRINTKDYSSSAYFLF